MLNCKFQIPTLSAGNTININATNIAIGGYVGIDHTLSKQDTVSLAKISANKTSILYISNSVSLFSDLLCTNISISSDNTLNLKDNSITVYGKSVRGGSDANITRTSNKARYYMRWGYSETLFNYHYYQEGIPIFQDILIPVPIHINAAINDEDIEFDSSYTHSANDLVITWDLDLPDLRCFYICDFNGTQNSISQGGYRTADTDTSTIKIAVSNIKGDYEWSDTITTNNTIVAYWDGEQLTPENPPQGSIIIIKNNASSPLSTNLYPSTFIIVQNLDVTNSNNNLYAANATVSKLTVSNEETFKPSELRVLYSTPNPLYVLTAPKLIDTYIAGEAISTSANLNFSSLVSYFKPNYNINLILRGNTNQTVTKSPCTYDIILNKEGIGSVTLEDYKSTLSSGKEQPESDSAVNTLILSGDFDILLGSDIYVNSLYVNDTGSIDTNNCNLKFDELQYID